MSLAVANVLYRRPDWYDALHTPATARISWLISRYRRDPAQSILDLGCGTGSFLAELPREYRRRVGIDLQPAMIEYGRTVRCSLDLRVGDIRDLRLAETFDVLTCIGCTLAYLDSECDLSAAAETIAAHTHHGSVVIVHTLTDIPHRPGPVVTCLTLDGHPVEVMTTYEWRPPFLTTHRRWKLPAGETIDHLRRRVWSTDQLYTIFVRVGLRAAGVHGDYHVYVREE